MKLTVTEEFINLRTDKRNLYNRRGRTEEAFLMDLDAELYEHHMITTGQWEDYDDWKVDAVVPGVGNVDVKFISKWYNISNVKMLNILQQRFILDAYVFMEWVGRPQRPLEAGDEVDIRYVKTLLYDDLCDRIKVSRGKWGGFYADVRAS